MAAAFLREVGALLRNNNAVEVAKRLHLSSTDSSKKQYVDTLPNKPYQA